MKNNLFTFIRKAILDYKIYCHEQSEKNKLLSSKSNWNMIETFIKKCNDNPNLVVEIRLKDSTIIKLGTYVKPSKDYYSDFEKVE